MSASEINEYAERQKLSRGEIADYLNTDGVVSSVEFHRLLGDAAESCVDGRSETGVIGTPGGNAGEFLLTLGAVEKLIPDEEFSDEQVLAIFREYTNKLGKFYFHTDEHALEVVRQIEVADVSKYFKSDNPEFPPPELRERLLNELVSSAAIGCGHIKLMLTRAEEYGVRPELVQSFIRAFYQELWAGNEQLELVVLQGDHQEGAVLTVLLDESIALTDDTLIPTIAPSGADSKIQMFVHHPGVVEYMRKRTAVDALACVRNGSGILSDISLEVGGKFYQDYVKMIGEIGARQLPLTVGTLAKGLPLHTAIFKVKEGTWDIQVF